MLEVVLWTDWWLVTLWGLANFTDPEDGVAKTHQLMIGSNCTGVLYQDFFCMLTVVF